MNKKIYAAGLSAALCLLFAPSAHAQALQTFARDWAFQDAPNSGWFFGGVAGYDIHVPWARVLGNGYGNDVWINATTPSTWNSVNVVFDPGWSEFRGNTEICDVKAWIETGYATGAPPSPARFWTSGRPSPKASARSSTRLKSNPPGQTSTSSKTSRSTSAALPARS